MGRRRIHYINPGDRFGRLTVVEQVQTYMDKHRKRLVYLCRCDCGELTRVIESSLAREVSATRSCGCLRSDLARERIKTIHLARAER